MSREIDLQTLGLRRSLLLDCLGANTPQAPGYLEVPPGADVLAVYQDYVAELSRTAAYQADPTTMLLVAAARLLTGEISWATTVLERLPTAPPAQRFGQRYCPLMPYRTLLAVLPLPKELTNLDRWIAGSPEQAALLAWLARHGGQLQWRPAEARYVLPAP